MSESAPSVFEDPDLQPTNPTRSIAAEARLLSENPAFKLACANLSKHYMRNFCALEPKKLGIHYAEACMNAQRMLNIIGDVTTQLQMLADHNKFDVVAAERTMKGGAAS